MSLKINNKKFIYLISPNNISDNFYQNLKLVLKTGKISFFQLRLKKYSLKKKMLIGKKIKQICKKNNVKFLVNDDPLLAKKLRARSDCPRHSLRKKECRSHRANRRQGRP